MVRTLLILVLSVVYIKGFAQSNNQKEKHIIFYPINIPAAVIGKFQASVEFGVNELDYFLRGGHYNKGEIIGSKNGWGFEAQFRVNFNRDVNVNFDRIGYLGPYLEYDLLFSNANKPQSKLYEVRQLSLGLLYGSKFSFGKRVILDLFLGIGLAGRENTTLYKRRSNFLYSKAGIQFGFKL